MAIKKAIGLTKVRHNQLRMAQGAIPNPILRLIAEGVVGAETLFSDLYKHRKGKNFPRGKVIDRTLDQISDKSRSKSKPMAYRRTASRGRSSTRGRKTYKKKTYKRKRTSTKRTIRKSSKKRKTSKKKNVSLTVGTARERRVEHRAVEDNHCAYVAFSSVGERAKQLKMVSQAILLHYMHRVGDYRASKTMSPDGIYSTASQIPTDTGQMSCWSSMIFQFITLNTSGSTASSVADQFELFSYSGTSQTAVSAHRTLTELTDLLNDELFTQFQAGKRLSSVIVTRGGPHQNGWAVLNDISAGRNIIEFSSKAKMKIQNTTNADVGSLGDVCDRQNALSINRNPVDGLAYTFKNQVPLFKAQYLVSKDDTVRDALDDLQNSYSGVAGGVNCPTELTD